MRFIAPMAEAILERRGRSLLGKGGGGILLRKIFVIQALRNGVSLILRISFFFLQSWRNK